MRHIHIALSIVLLAAAGCSKDAKTADEREERDPLIKQGQSYMEIRDYKKAEEAFKKALEKDPLMARPHLDLATIYQQYDVNYFHAVYHYDRYLELRPDSEKAEFIREQIQKVQKALFNDILTRSGAYQLKNERDRLIKENTELKSRLTAGTPPPAEAPKTETAASGAGTTAAAPPAHEIYTVVAGDNLTKIANKFYGNGNYEPIYEANKDRMKSPGDLRVGQTLVIPKR